MDTRHYLDLIMVYWSVALLLPLLVQSRPRIYHEGLPIDCEDVFKNGSIHDGVYTIYPVGEDSPMEVYCDMGCSENENHEGGHWTVIQRRMDGSVNFDRTYDTYKEGFGYKDGEYWLGLENMHLLTRGRGYALRIDLEDFAGAKVYALYPNFFVESALDGYRLRLFDFTNGGAGNSLAKHNGRWFSTFDKDQDTWHWGGQCAKGHSRGGFWFHSCLDANPNGRYQWRHYNGDGTNGVYWSTWSPASLKAITMKVKRVFLADEGSS
ncbi:microfibril-associated glycoprotein 4-like [Alosa sapidissima]|uniref:microfibril-associated glycoprotein 4-like n=1 Tax=Alosa sapidissima TaxID=34773 RepID=UPI001C08D6C5|nr:microfibril-associated glycoprotein 4-like [Alosa sapidissima]